MTRVFFICPYLNKNRKHFQVVLLFFVTLSIFNSFNERGSSFFNLPTSTPPRLNPESGCKIKTFLTIHQTKKWKFWWRTKFVSKCKWTLPICGIVYRFLAGAKIHSNMNTNLIFLKVFWIFFFGFTQLSDSLSFQIKWIFIFGSSYVFDVYHKRNVAP